MISPNLNEMLKDRAFVDYFNIYLCQPIFGHGLIYRFNEMQFVLSARFHDHENLTPQKLQEWLEVERFPGFFRTRFYYEYKMCSMLRETPLKDLATVIDWGCEYFNLSIAKLLENMFSSYTGMQLFKLSLMDSGGERVWRCMFDIDDYCNDETDVDAQLDLHNHLRMTYFASGSEFEINESTKLHYFSEKYRSTYSSTESNANYLSELSMSITTDNYDGRDDRQLSDSSTSIDRKQSHTSTDSDPSIDGKKNKSDPSIDGKINESNPSIDGKNNKSGPSISGKKNESNPSIDGKKNKSDPSTDGKKNESNPSIDGKKNKSDPLIECKKNESNPSIDGKKNKSDPLIDGKKNESNPLIDGKKNKSDPSIGGKKNESNPLIDGKNNKSDPSIGGKKNESNPSIDGKNDESDPSIDGKKDESDPSIDIEKNKSDPSTNGTTSQSETSTDNRNTRNESDTSIENCNTTNNSTVVHPVMFDGIGYVQMLFDYSSFLNEPRKALLHLSRILSLALLNYWKPRFVLDVNAAIKDIHPEAEIHCNYHTEPKGGRGLRPFNIDPTMDTIWEESAENVDGSQDPAETETPQTSSKIDVAHPLIETPPTKPNQLEPLKASPLKIKKDISATTRRLLFGNQEIPAYLQAKLSTKIIKILSSELTSGHPFRRYLVANEMEVEVETLVLWHTLCKFIKMRSVTNQNYRRFFTSHYASRLIMILMRSETLITSHMADLIRDSVNTLLIEDSSEHHWTLLEMVYEIALLLLKPWKTFRSANMRTFSEMMTKQGFLFSRKTQFDVRRQIAPDILCSSDILNLQCLTQFCYYTPDIYEVEKPEKVRKLPDINNVGYYIMSKQSKIKRKKITQPKAPKVFDSKFYHSLRPRAISIRDIKVYPMKPLAPAECPSDSLSLSKSDETLLPSKEYYKGLKHTGHYEFVKNTRTERNRFICKRLIRRLCFFIKAMREEKNAVMLAKYASYVSKLKSKPSGSLLRGKKTARKFQITKFKRRNMARVKPEDVMFLSDVLHYKHVIMQSLKRGHMTENKRLSKNMADRILTKYLIPDKQQMRISVSKSMALKTQMELKREGVTRTLFHDAFLKILPAAYHLWSSLEQFTIDAGGREAAWAELTGEDGYMDGQLADDGAYTSGVKPIIAKIQMKSSFRKRGTRSVLGKRETRLLAEYKRLQKSLYMDRRRRSIEFNSKHQPFPEPLFHIAIPTMETNFLRGLIGVRGGSALDFVLVK